jgi:hypothetical protein
MTDEEFKEQVDEELEALLTVIEIPRLGEGDILQIRVGVKELDPPWIPDTNELDYVRLKWEKVVPEGVKVIATHFGEEAVVIKTEDGGVRAED